MTSPAALSDAECADDTAEREFIPRADVRRPIAMPTRVRDAAGGTFSGTVEDISENGCRVRIDGIQQMEPGRAVAISLAGIEAQAACTVWSDDGVAGFAFQRPLYVAVVDSLAARFAAV